LTIIIIIIIIRSEDISKLTSVEQLPANAIAYLQRIEALVGVPVRWIGLGPGREQTVEWRAERFA
jgi:adenylosuccinate synthase